MKDVSGKGWIDIKIDGPLDLQEDDFLVQVVDFDPSSGRISTAIRVTHLPSGACVTSDTHLSQRMNRERAMLDLAGRLNRSQGAVD